MINGKTVDSALIKNHYYEGHRAKVRSNRMSIIFGLKDHYFKWHFNYQRNR